MWIRTRHFSSESTLPPVLFDSECLLFWFLFADTSTVCHSCYLFNHKSREHEHCLGENLDDLLHCHRFHMFLDAWCPDSALMRRRISCQLRLNPNYRIDSGQLSSGSALLSDFGLVPHRILRIIRAYLSLRSITGGVDPGETALVRVWYLSHLVSEYYV